MKRTPLEQLDRRAFLRGMMVTSAGLLVPMPTVILPATRRMVVRTYDPSQVVLMWNGIPLASGFHTSGPIVSARGAP